MAEQKGNEWLGKEIYVILNKINSMGKNYEYHGKIRDVQDFGSGIIIWEIIDKFGKMIIFNSKEIKFMEEKNGEQNF